MGIYASTQPALLFGSVRRHLAIRSLVEPRATPSDVAAVVRHPQAVLWGFFPEQKAGRTGAGTFSTKTDVVELHRLLTAGRTLWVPPPLRRAYTAIAERRSEVSDKLLTGYFDALGDAVLESGQAAISPASGDSFPLSRLEASAVAEAMVLRLSLRSPPARNTQLDRYRLLVEELDRSGQRSMVWGLCLYLVNDRLEGRGLSFAHRLAALEILAYLLPRLLELPQQQAARMIADLPSRTDLPTVLRNGAKKFRAVAAAFLPAPKSTGPIARIAGNR